jgi:UrcA family protein
MSIRHILAAAAAGVAGFTTTLIAMPPAHAMETASSVRVSYDDLNLRNAAGRAALERRIEIAARAVCGSAAERDVKHLQRTRTCQEEAKSSARQQLARSGQAQLS